MKAIRIHGARTHNLKDIDVVIPRERLVVITGPSGSGKSSLAFDTLYAEGQRRYVESLSVSARHMVARLPRPDVDRIDGLPPTVAIAQRVGTHHPRATVGTVTEIHDFLRLLFARAGTPHCVACGAEIAPFTLDQMLDAAVTLLPEGTRFSVLAPVARGLTDSPKALFQRLQKNGYVRVLVNGAPRDLDERAAKMPKAPWDIDVVVDRLVSAPNMRNRLADSLELALEESGGQVRLAQEDGLVHAFTSQTACAACGAVQPEFTPADFSFNAPKGACPQCAGLGEVRRFDVDKIIPAPGLSLRDGAIAPWTRRSAHYFRALLDAVAVQWHIDPFSPWRDLSGAAHQLLLEGSDAEVRFTVTGAASTQTFQRVFEGVIPNLERRYKEYLRRNRDEFDVADHGAAADEFAPYMSAAICDACQGRRLKPESLSVRVGGAHIAELSEMTVSALASFFSDLALPSRQQAIAAPLRTEIQSRLGFLSRIGLGYLSLSRRANTLSGGESQRVRIATQLGASLCGVCYVLDEPSAGLHAQDNARLLDTLRALVSQENTVVVVEHDSDTLRAADHLIDMGPGAGTAGGEVVATGTPAQVAKNRESVTGDYLSGRLQVAAVRQRRPVTDRAITLKNACTHNLKDVTVRFPLGVFVAVTGVSGSGKSSLVMDTLLPRLQQSCRHPKGPQRKTLMGARHVDRVVAVDQRPIGLTHRSNPATYTGVLRDIRELFAALPESRVRGWDARRFSFNLKGGRCEACGGEGWLRIEMAFLPDAATLCEVCQGRRFNRETLEVAYRGLNIDAVLALTIAEAATFFEHHPRLHAKLDVLRRIGLGYLALGQGAHTLSGGEAQRLKLSRELMGRVGSRTCYILDEPTCGLHASDVQVLLEVLHALVDAGNTVLAVEHHLDVIADADHVIELGPGPGEAGGEVVAYGTPEEVAQCDTPTGAVLGAHLARRTKE